MSNTVSYESDLYGWAMRQAELLREGRFAEADTENIAEEIESLGQSQKRELRNRLAVLLAHLLKWQFQPGRRGDSWRATIREQRLRLDDHLRDNPSLRRRLDEVLAEAYRRAVLRAQSETGFAQDTFPADCPYSAGQVFDPDFFPG